MAVSHIKSDTIADFTGTVTGFNSQGSTITIAATDLVRPVDWNSAHNQFYSLTGNTNGNSTASGSNVLFAGSGGITIGGSTGTVVVSGPVPITNSLYINHPLVNSSTVTLNGASISHAVYFNVPNHLSFAFLRFPGSMTTNSTTISTMASASATAQGHIVSTLNAVIYSLGTGGNSRSLQSVTSASVGFTMSHQISVTNSTQGSYSLGVTQRVQDVSTTLTIQYSISNTNYSFTTQQIVTNFSGARYIDLPFAGSLTPGGYWLVAGLSTTTTTQGAAGLAALTNCNVRYTANYAVSQAALSFGEMGSTNLTSNPWMFAGSFSTAGGGTTNSIPISALSSIANQAFILFMLARSA